MSTHFSSFIAAILAAGSVASAQDVAYEKFVLDNGMTVILHEDHSLPQATVNIWYRVGSKDESAGRSGFAHLFEHLMFMGTERVPGSGFDDMMEAGGGHNNASTSTDWTNYYSIGPAELLPTLLWLDADRLQDLGKAMTQEKLDKQREVVRNERRQTSENRPYGRAQLKSFELLYPEGHPYRIPVIGTHSDLKAGTVEDVKEFFRAYYVPNNASLVVAGDFDPAVILPLVESLFGTLPLGADVRHVGARPVKLEREEVFTMTDAVQFAQTSITWHSPAIYAAGDAEMDLLAAILADGVSSRLVQALVVDEQLAVDVGAFQASRMLGSTFTVNALARPGVRLEDLEAGIDRVLAKLVSDGVSASELGRQQAKIEHDVLAGLQSLGAKADRLNAYEFYFDEPNSFAKDLDRYRSATRDGVRAMAEETFAKDARLVMRVLPETPAPEVDPRDTRPTPLATRAFAPAAPEVFSLSNGISVQHWERRELPLVELAVLLPTGAACDPPGKAGLADLTAEMLDEGAGERSAVEFAGAIELLGASLGASVDQERTSIRLSALRRTLDGATELMADALLLPRFDASEWSRVHDQHLQGLRRRMDDPNAVALRVGSRAFFGDAHPYGRPVGGTPDSAAAITLDDVRQFHAAAFRPTGATILIAGDLSREEAQALLEAQLGAWSDPEGIAAPAPAPATDPSSSAPRVLIVDRPGAVQTVVRFMMNAPRYADSGRTSRQLLGTILGGTFTSRLNQNLREEHGYTYGARSSFIARRSAGYFVASANVQTDVTGESLREFLGEFNKLRTGDVSEVEAEKARRSVRSRLVESFAGLGGVLSAADTLVVNGVPFDALRRDLETIDGLTMADLNRAAKTALPIEGVLLVLVGDKGAILSQLEGLPLPAPVIVDADGDVVSGG